MNSANSPDAHREDDAVRCLDLVLAQALHEGASDVHFEPFAETFRLRFRLDGVLREQPSLPLHLALPLTSRLKVLADLDITERRRPQDGRFPLTVGTRSIDVRLSTLPTEFGESVVLRMLDPAATRLDLGALGLPPTVLADFSAVIRRPHGLVIVTGPTGSGKTTTLYGALRAIASPEVKVLTAEDPVEYEIEGVVQVPIHPRLGFTFAQALRAFLRQDPDIILVGEIRDLETARTAVQAALTGHLVLTTLHTNDAPGALLRLQDMGVEPFLLASCLTGVLAQRLARRLCPHCRVAYQETGDDESSAGLLAAAGGAAGLYRARGCPRCHGTGYQGRQGIFEWLRVTGRWQAALLAGADEHELRALAQQEGLRTLREECLRLLRTGVTTLEEVAPYL